MKYLIKKTNITNSKIKIVKPIHHHPSPQSIIHNNLPTNHHPQTFFTNTPNQPSAFNHLNHPLLHQLGLCVLLLFIQVIYQCFEACGGNNDNNN